jgi:hypothetical protein
MPSSSPFFIDANVPIYAVGIDHPYKEPCDRIIQAVIVGELSAVTDAEIIQEIIHRYLSQRRPEGLQIAGSFMTALTAASSGSLSSQESILPVTATDMTRCLALLREYPFLRTRDAVHTAVMLEHGISNIITADRHFDQVKEVIRHDPLTFSW